MSSTLPRTAIGLLSLLLMRAPALAERGCVLEAKKPTPFAVEVVPKAAARISIYVREAAVTVSLQAAGAPARVHVLGALEFDATVATEHLPLRTAREVDATNAMIHLARDLGGPGAVVVRGALRGNQLLTDLRVHDVTLRGLALPCAAFTLEAVPAAEMKPSSREEEKDQAFMPRTKLLHLRGFANRGSSIGVELLVRLDSFDLRRSTSEGPWLRVSHEWIDGSSIDGWVHRDELEPQRRGSLEDAPLPDSPTPITCTREPKTRNAERLARATIAPGTKVYAGRGVAPWATVRTSEPMTIRSLTRDDWVEVLSVPGLVGGGECPERSSVLDDAWVPRSAVKIVEELPSTPPATSTP